MAVARKLLVALWKYLETGEVPAGAEVVEKRKFRERAGGHRGVVRRCPGWESELFERKDSVGLGQ